MGRKPGFHSGGHAPRKRFGQNFLEDPHIIDAIVNAIHPRSTDIMVEIGPGMAALTRHLVSEVDQFHAIELDRDLAPFLLASFAVSNRFHLHQADALRFDYGSLAPTDGRKLRLVGNLPYNISTPLIFHLLGFADRIEDMHFMLQKEVVDRLAAGVGEDAYGRLGIMVQYHCQVEAVLHVPPTAFNPPPKVDSAVVRLIPHATPPHVATDVRALGRLVTEAFNQRRKTLRNALKQMATPDDLDACGIDAGLRPEDIGLAAWVRLSNYLLTRSGSSS